MLPDCMQGPSEPCAGYTAQSASIAALEAELLKHTLMWYAERKRREDAEALLRGVRTSTIDQLDFEIAPLIDAHFSRYKD